MRKWQIHTTLEPDTLKWIDKICNERKINKNSLLEEVIKFYQKNKDIEEQFDIQKKANISMLKDVIRDIVQGGMIINFNEKRCGEKWEMNTIATKDYVPADAEKH